MLTEKITLTLGKISDNILDACYHQDEMTTSDLQGVIEAQVMIAYQLGKNNFKL